MHRTWAAQPPCRAGAGQTAGDGPGPTRGVTLGTPGARAIRPTPYPGRVPSCGPGQQRQSLGGPQLSLSEPMVGQGRSPAVPGSGVLPQRQGRGGRRGLGRVEAGGTRSERRRVERGRPWRGGRRGRDGGAGPADRGPRLLGSSGSSGLPSLNAARPLAPPTAPHAAPCGGGDAPRRLRLHRLLFPPRGQPCRLLHGEDVNPPPRGAEGGQGLLSPSTRPPPSPAPRRSAGADPSRPPHATPLLPALRVRRRLHVGGRSSPSPRRAGLPLSRAGRGPHAPGTSVS